MRALAVTSATPDATVAGPSAGRGVRARLRGCRLAGDRRARRTRRWTSSTSSIVRSMPGWPSRRYKSRFTDLGAEIFAGSPADFGKFIVDYTEKWAPGDPRGRRQGGIALSPIDLEVRQPTGGIICKLLFTNRMDCRVKPGNDPIHSAESDSGSAPTKRAVDGAARGTRCGSRSSSHVAPPRHAACTSMPRRSCPPRPTAARRSR